MIKKRCVKCSSLNKNVVLLYSLTFTTNCAVLVSFVVGLVRLKWQIRNVIQFKATNFTLELILNLNWCANFVIEQRYLTALLFGNLGSRNKTTYFLSTEFSLKYKIAQENRSEKTRLYGEICWTKLWTKLWFCLISLIRLKAKLRHVFKVCYFLNTMKEAWNVKFRKKINTFLTFFQENIRIYLETT
jgi:hypothetical protein